MKKTIALVLVFMLALSLAACGKDDSKPSGGDKPGTQKTPQPDTSTPVPDPAPSEAGAQEDERSGWLNTRTGKFYNQFADGKMFMEYETEQEGMVLTVISATSGDKTYSESKADGQSMGAVLMDGKDMYTIDHASKMIIKMSVQASSQEIMDTMLKESDVDLAGLVTGKREIDGKPYDTEEWGVDEGKTILCFEGDTLAYMIGAYGGTEMVIKVLKVSGEVDDSLFELPEGYQMASM